MENPSEGKLTAVEDASKLCSNSGRWWSRGGILPGVEVGQQVETTVTGRSVSLEHKKAPLTQICVSLKVYFSLKPPMLNFG